MPAKAVKTVVTRKWRDICIQDLTSDLLSALPQSDFSSPVTAVEMYNTTLSSILDKHCPPLHRTITIRPNTEWYTADMMAAKRECRKLERQYKRTGLTIHHDLYRMKRNEVHRMREHAKIQHYNQKIEATQNQKDLFRLINSLSGSPATQSLPQSDNSLALANRFAQYFDVKIENIRKEVETQMSQSTEQQPSVTVNQPLNNFTLLTEGDVIKHLSKMKSKSCCLDPIPTWLLKDCKDVLAPLLTSIINLSLSSGVFPSQLKEATVTPILKKTSLDTENLKNYRPVSNLPFLSKLIEREVSHQFTAHLEANNINTKFQSAYKVLHSTDTALTRVQNDILQAVDREGGAILVLLDLSAAFDTIDHLILLQLLGNQMGVGETVLAWFKSYLSGRKHRVCVDGTMSEERVLNYGVPQGSVLGPVLFTTYTQPLHAVLHDIDFHLYADDSRMYLAFNPSSSDSTNTAVSTIQQCFSKVKAWMTSHFLKLNDAKTEVLVITPPALSKQLVPLTLQLGESAILPSQHVRDLGVTWDSAMRLEQHITNICKSAYHQLHNIYRIRKYLTKDATKSVVHAFITSRLDYCNSLLYGTPSCLLNRLQRVQNTAARLITGTPRSSHITPVLRELHWLPVTHRIIFKVALLTYKAQHGLAPLYLSELLTPYTPSRSLRSGNKNLLTVPSYKLKSYGGRSFTCVAPMIWNDLPDNLRSATSLTAFKSGLKTYLFQDAYNV